MVTFDFFSFRVQDVEALGSSTMSGATGPLGDSYIGLVSPFQVYEIPLGPEGRGLPWENASPECLSLQGR